VRSWVSLKQEYVHFKKMHKKYETLRPGRAGCNRTALDTEAEQCAGWYSTAHKKLLLVLD